MNEKQKQLVEKFAKEIEAEYGEEFVTILFAEKIKGVLTRFAAEHRKLVLAEVFKEPVGYEIHLVDSDGQEDDVLSYSPMEDVSLERYRAVGERKLYRDPREGEGMRGTRRLEEGEGA